MYTYSNGADDPSCVASYPSSVMTIISVKNEDLNGYSGLVETGTIPSSPYKLQLSQGVLEQTTVTVTANGAARSIVPYGQSPTVSQVAIDLDNGVLQFNAADTGKTASVSYTGKGSALSSHLINKLQKEVIATQTELDGLSATAVNVTGTPVVQYCIPRFNDTTGLVVSESLLTATDSLFTVPLNYLITASGNVTNVMQIWNDSDSYSGELRLKGTHNTSATSAKVVLQSYSNPTTYTRRFYTNATGAFCFDNNTTTSGGTIYVGGISVGSNLGAVTSFVDSSRNVTAGTISGSTITSTNLFLSPSGTVSAPAYSFTSDTDTGIYLAGANTLAVTASGNQVATFTYVANAPTLTMTGADAQIKLMGSTDTSNGASIYLGDDFNANDVMLRNRDGSLYLYYTADGGTSLKEVVRFNLASGGALPLSFQGATDNSYRTSIGLIDPTADRDIYLPNASGTFAVSASGTLTLNATTGALTWSGSSPGAIGGTTPAAGTFTTLGFNSSLSGGNAASATFLGTTTISNNNDTTTGALVLTGTDTTSATSAKITFNSFSTPTTYTRRLYTSATGSFVFDNNSTAGATIIAGAISLGSNVSSPSAFVDSSRNVTAGTISGSTITATTAFALPNGTVSAPSAYFTNDTDNGFYLSGTNQVAISIAGAQKMNWATTYINFPVQLLSELSYAVGTPAYSKSGDSNTGVAFPAADTVGIITGGKLAAQFGAADGSKDGIFECGPITVSANPDNTDYPYIYLNDTSGDPGTGSFYYSGIADAIYFNTATVFNNGVTASSFSSNSSVVASTYLAGKRDVNVQSANSVTVSTGMCTRRLYVASGQTALAVYSMPSAVAGDEIILANVDSDGIKIIPASGDNIRIGASVCTTTTGYVQSTTIGATITLCAIDSTTWLAIGTPAGTWSVV